MIKENENKKTVRAIEEILFPDCNEMKMDKDGILTSTIVDAELDPIECEFNDGGDAVRIDTKKLSYILLTGDNLLELIDLLEEAHQIEKKISDGNS